MDELDRPRVNALQQRKTDRIDPHERDFYREERSTPGQESHDIHGARLCVIKAEYEQEGSGNHGNVKGGGPGGNDGRIHVRQIVWDVVGS